MIYPLADMTCIVGSTDGQTVILAGDSAAIGQGSEIYTLSEPKVFSCGPYVLGVCGSYRVAQILRCQAQLPEPPRPCELGPFLVRDVVPTINDLIQAEGVASAQPSYLGDKVALLLGYHGQLWHIGSDLAVLPLKQFAAIGSGRHWAYAALYALQQADIQPVERRLELALEATAQYTATVRAPWQFVRGERS